MSPAVRKPRDALRLGRLVDILRRVQHELFNLGSQLSTLPKDLHPKQARITPAEIEQLEREIDSMNEELPRCAVSCCREEPG